MAGRGRPRKNPIPDDSQTGESNDSVTQEPPTDSNPSAPENDNNNHLPEIDLSQFGGIPQADTSFKIDSLDANFTPDFSSLSQPSDESQDPKKTDQKVQAPKRKVTEYKCGYCDYQSTKRRGVSMHCKRQHKDKEVKIIELKGESEGQRPYVEIIAYNWSKEMFSWFGDFVADKRGNHWKFTEKNHNMITKPGHRLINRALARFFSEGSGDAIAFAFGMMMYCGVNYRKDKKLKRIEAGEEEPEPKEQVKEDIREEQDIAPITTSFKRPVLSVAEQ